jgi:hypothetical protein
MRDAALARRFGEYVISPQPSQGGRGSCVRVVPGCGRGDSNPHGLSPVALPSRRVYQFRHARTRRHFGATSHSTRSGKPACAGEPKLPARRHLCVPEYCSLVRNGCRSERLCQEDHDALRPLRPDHERLLKSAVLEGPDRARLSPWDESTPESEGCPRAAPTRGRGGARQPGPRPAPRRRAAGPSRRASRPRPTGSRRAS